MFSSRLDWHAQPNRVSKLLAARRAAGLPVLDLTQSNPTAAGIDYPSDAILEALADRRSLVYEPAPAGSREARLAVTGYYGRRGHDVDPEDILLTASTSESYGFLFKLLAGPGDEVLVPRPSYPLFEFLASLESLRAVPYSLAYHGRWGIDFGSLQAAAGPRTRAIIIVNPNNHTGSFLSREELAAVSELARERDLALVCDEVFADFALEEGDPRRVATVADWAGAPAFALSGLSKVAGLPQIKLGWIAIAGPADFRDAARERLETIADTYLSVSTPVQHAAARLIGSAGVACESIRRRTRGNLALLREKLTAIPALEILRAEGGWYAVIRVPRTRSEEEWVLELLDRHGVLVQPGFFYDFEQEAFLVVSLLTAPSVFEAGIDRLLEMAHSPAD